MTRIQQLAIAFVSVITVLLCVYPAWPVAAVVVTFIVAIAALESTRKQDDRADIALMKSQIETFDKLVSNRYKDFEEIKKLAEETKQMLSVEKLKANLKR